MAVKFGLLVFPPMWSAFVRFVIGIICIVAWAAFRGIPMWPKKGEWRLLISLGVLFVIQMGTLNIGFDLTQGSIAAILISPVRFFLSDFIAGLGACAQENTDAHNSTADGDSFLKKFAWIQIIY